MTTDRYRTLGRIAGADLARALVEVLSRAGVDAREVAAAGEAAIRNHLVTLEASGATSDHLQTFGEAADRRYGEALAEIMVQAELGILAADGPSGATH